MHRTTRSKKIRVLEKKKARSRWEDPLAHDTNVCEDGQRFSTPPKPKKTPTRIDEGFVHEPSTRARRKRNERSPGMGRAGNTR